MTTRRVVMIAIAAVVVGASLIAEAFLLAARSDHSDQTDRERCLYAAVDKVSTIPKGDSVFTTLSECKHLPKSDQRKIQAMMISFIEDAFTRAGE